MLAPALLLLLLHADPAGATEPTMPDEAKLAQLSAQFAPVELSVDLAALSGEDRLVLKRLVEASRLLDAIFLRQVWSGNASALLRVSADATPLGRARLAYFLINKGPWDRVDKNRPFVPGVPPKPDGGGFYPDDATKLEIEAWHKTLPVAERTRASGFFTAIRRGPTGKLTAVPFALAYNEELVRAAQLLEEAAGAAQEPTLKAFLDKRAKAFLTDDYYASDVAWMQLDAAIEPTIGPYEVYEDGWFNAKAAYESFIAVRDAEETAKLARFSSRLQELEDHLPIDPSLRNPKLGALAPIRVVNELYASGDAAHGVQTAAFNLPNDERVVQKMGSKRVMLKNVQEAKFNRVLMPIAEIAIPAEDLPRVAFSAFFTHILMHELMHGLGPHSVKARGKTATVRESLKETYSALEEAKADISGLWAMQYLVDHGAIDKSIEPSMYVTYLASSFRSIRFGLTEAHGKGIALQLNYLLDRGAFKVGATGRFAVDETKVKAGVEALTTEIMTIQAKGDYAAARALLDRMAVVRPEVQAVLDRLGAVPIDIDPRFTTAQALLGSR
jgi:hypothetical protein